MAAELRTALAGLSSCLPGGPDVLPELPEHSRFTVTAHVTQQGVVSRASAHAGGWPRDVLRCIERLAGAARLRAPVPDAPRAVTAHVEVERVGGAPADGGRRARAEPWRPTSGVPISDVPGRPPTGPSGRAIGDVPGREPSGPQGVPISDVPGRKPTGPTGRPPSH